MADDKLKVKLTLLDFTLFSQPAFKAHGEYLIHRGLTPVSVGLDLGYIFHSADEDVKARGFYAGTRINLFTRNNPSSAFAWSFSVFGSRIRLSDYLKYTAVDPGLGTYYYYKITDYSKARYGCGLEALWQKRILNSLFFEISTGLGLVKFETNISDDVTQKTFVNGLTKGRTYTGPTVLFSMKLGYTIF